MTGSKKTYQSDFRRLKLYVVSDGLRSVEFRGFPNYAIGIGSTVISEALALPRNPLTYNMLQMEE